MSLLRKIRGSVNSEEIIRDNIRREDLLQLKWSDEWEWFVQLLRDREKAIADYKKSSPKALAMGVLEKPDKRSVLPFPLTTSSEYGWLSTKKEFQLEVYGSLHESSKLTANAPDASSSIFYSTSDL